MSALLQRRIGAVLGKSPLAFFQDMRVECAQHLISTGHDLKKTPVRSVMRTRRHCEIYCGVGSAAACGNYGQIRENITNDRLATKAYGGQ
jgi:AraC-like DNA-binding protein